MTVLGYPRMGPRRYDLSRELKFDRPAQVGATPFGDGPTLARDELDHAEETEKLTTSGTQVLPMS